MVLVKNDLWMYISAYGLWQNLPARPIGKKYAQNTKWMGLILLDHFNSTYIDLVINGRFKAKELWGNGESCTINGWVNILAVKVPQIQSGISQSTSQTDLITKPRITLTLLISDEHDKTSIYVVTHTGPREYISMALVGDTIHRAKTDSPISRSLMEENRNTLHVDLDTRVTLIHCMTWLESNRVFINPGPVPS